MDIVGQKLAKLLNVDMLEEQIEEAAVSLIATEQTAITSQPIYKSNLVTEADIDEFKRVKDEIGLDDFSRIILMKTASKAMRDHDELVSIAGKVDDSKAARFHEIGTMCLQTAADAAKAMLTLTMAREKMEIEREKLSLKASITINNNTQENTVMLNGSQNDILKQIKQMMAADIPEDDSPPLVIDHTKF